MGTHVREQEKCISRRPFLMGVAAGLAAAPLGMVAAVAADPDPVFAAIMAHESVMAEVDAYTARVAADERAHGPGPSEALELEGDPIFLRDRAARWAVITTVPTTSGGLARWVDHLSRDACFGAIHVEDHELFAMLATIRAFAEAGHA